MLRYFGILNVIFDIKHVLKTFNHIKITSALTAYERMLKTYQLTHAQYISIIGICYKVYHSNN